jgi:hypothetical protein
VLSDGLTERQWSSLWPVRIVDQLNVPRLRPALPRYAVPLEPADRHATVADELNHGVMRAWRRIFAGDCRAKPGERDTPTEFPTVLIGQIVSVGGTSAQFTQQYIYGSVGSAIGKLETITYPSGARVNYRYGHWSRRTCS